MGSAKTVLCDFCTYAWISRVQSPKSCPRCKRRFDYGDARVILKQLSEEFELDLVSGMPWERER